MWMMLSSGYIQLKICIAFCQTPRNDFDFDDEIRFENRPLHVLGINIVAKKMKQIFHSHVIVSTVHKLESKTAIQWSYMSRVLSHATKDRQRISSVMECTEIISRSLHFSPPSSHFMNTQSQSDSSEFFLLTRGGQMCMFNFKVCSVTVTLVLLMLF